MTNQPRKNSKRNFMVVSISIPRKMQQVMNKRAAELDRPVSSYLRQLIEADTKASKKAA